MPEPPPPAPSTSPGPPVHEARIESWGEIAAYLRRDVRTVQRWEQQYGLPIRRLIIGKQGQVFAFRSELDRWLKERQPEPEDDPGGTLQANGDKPAPDPDRILPPQQAEQKTTSKRTSWAWKMAVLTLLLLTALGWASPLPNFLNGIFFPEPQRRLLFVRPFTSLPADPEQQLFVRGLKDELIIQLGRLDPKSLGVFAPTTSDEEGGKSIEDLASHLHANYVLEGSVRKILDQLRIDVVLIGTNDKSQIWSKSYTGDARDILKLQDNVTLDVATQIRGTLPPVKNPNIRTATKPAVNDSAYKDYLEGNVHLRDRDLLRSKIAYERALKEETDYAGARAGLSMVYLLLGQSPNDALRPSDSGPLAREAAQAALQQDPNNADAYCVLANIAQSYDHDMAKAEHLFKQAIELDPSNLTAHEWYGYFLVVNNRFAEAITETNHALEIDPASPLLQNVQGEVFYYQRNFDLAIQQERQTLGRYPGFLYARIWLASAYREKKMYKEALQEFDGAREQSNDAPALLGLYAHSLAVSGNRAGAEKVLARLKLLSKNRYVPALYMAAVYSGLGDKENSLRCLEEAFKEQNDRLVYLGVDPLADSLRGDARFADLMKRCGLL